tara:strand:+ start:601 stop:876 length:276 start_codon:yes stop_codon:yes gene_type:complete
MIRLIEVKHYHISAGDQGCADNCAIALALKDEYMGVGCEVRLEDDLEIYVGTKSLTVDPKQFDYVKNWVYDFDCDKDVDPFTLRIVEEVGA